MTAAVDLTRRGKDIVVLEARDRIGGRVATVVHEGIGIEVGGQWVSPGHNCMHELIEAAGLSCGTAGRRPADPVAGKSSAAQPPRPQPRPHPFEWQTRPGLLRFRAGRAGQSDPSWAAANGVAGQPLSRWVKATLRTPAAQSDFSAILANVGEGINGDVSLGRALATTVNGTDLESLFAVSGGLKLCRVVGGMHQLADHLAAQLPEACLQLQQVVTGIDHDPEGVTVHTEAGDGTTRAHRARRVLVTLPPWLALRLPYNPPLPAWRDEAVQRQTSGHVIRVFAIYPTPWWREDGLSGQMSADEGPVRVTFDISDGDGPGILMGFFEGVEAATLSGRSQAIRERLHRSLAAVFGEQARQRLSIRLGAASTPAVATHISRRGLERERPVVGRAGRSHPVRRAEYVGKSNGYLRARSVRHDEAKAILRELG